MKNKLLIVLLILVVATMSLAGCSLFLKDVTLTFDTGGGSAVAPFVGKPGDIIAKPDNPTREGYEFGGWYKDSALTMRYVFATLPSEDFTIYAKWENIKYTITLHGNGGTGSNITEYKEGESVVLPTDWTREGYTFAGWYRDSAFTSNKIDKIDKNDTGDKQFYAKWVKTEPNAYIVTLNGNGGVGTMIDSYKEGEETLLPRDWSRDGYTFMGWYESKDCSGSAVDKILANDTGNRTYYAKWQANKYAITFVTNGGDAIAPIIVEFGSDITLPDIARSGYIFEGWYLDNLLSEKMNLQKMPSHDITLYAKWISGYQLTYVSNGVDIFSEEITTETAVLDTPDIFHIDEPLYYFGGWYFDEDYKTRCNDTIKMLRNTTVYAKWDSMSFIDRKAEYDRAYQHDGVITVNSRDEFIDLVDYIMFTSKAGTYRFKLTYLHPNTAEARGKEIYDVVDNEITTMLWADWAYSDAETSYIQIGMNPKVDFVTEGFTKVPQQELGIEQKMPYALDAPYTPKRSSTWDNFKYKQYMNSVEVVNSNQLFYALEYGIEPICKKGSSAEDQMNKAKDILREICDDSMSDLDKIYAIFTWFVTNVYYDHTAAKNYTLITDAVHFDAWQMEGVFNNRTAVCDGISKAVVVLAGLEGIPCVRETSDTHAWNKVYIDVDGNGQGEWYGLDATWGSSLATISDKTYEMFSAMDFLFTDAYKESKKFVGTNNDELVANTNIDVYRAMTFEQSGKTYDLVMDNKSDIDVLIAYVHDIANKSTYKQATFMLKTADSMSNLAFENNMKDARKKVNAKSMTDKNINLGYLQYTQMSSNEYVILVTVV